MNSLNNILLLSDEEGTKGLQQQKSVSRQTVLIRQPITLSSHIFHPRKNQEKKGLKVISKDPLIKDI